MPLDHILTCPRLKDMETEVRLLALLTFRADMTLMIFRVSCNAVEVKEVDCQHGRLDAM